MSSNRGHRAGQCAPEVPRTRIRARGDLQERRTWPGRDISSGVGNSSAQTVGVHALVNGRTRKRSAAGGWSEAEVCAEEVTAPRVAAVRKLLRGRCSSGSRCGSIGKQLPAEVPMRRAIGKPLRAGKPQGIKGKMLRAGKAQGSIGKQQLAGKVQGSIGKRLQAGEKQRWLWVVRNGQVRGS